MTKILLVQSKIQIIYGTLSKRELFATAPPKVIALPTAKADAFFL